MKLHLDFETRSAVDLKKVGLWAYAMHPSTDVLCAGFCITGYRERVWTRNDVAQRGRDVEQQIGKGYLVSAHNAPFERAIWEYVLHRRYGWPAPPPPSQWRCTMAKALACGLPADLDSLGRVLKIKTPKDLDGRKVMMRLCKPRPDGTFDEDPAALERLYAYNATDVRAEMEVDELVPDLSPDEQKVWEMDLEINRRGVAVDLNLARRGAALSTALVDRLNGQLQEMTGGAVDKATQVTALKYYLSDRYGINTESLDKESIVELMIDPLVPEEARRILSVRRQVGKKTSMAKYQAALDMACPDGRVRGLLQYHAAHTGRWGGRGLQPHNFPKGWEKVEQQAEALSYITTPDEAALEMLGERYGDGATDALSNTLRGLFVAGEGKTLVCGDFNAIEARVLFWLAGEQEALAAYRRGESPYLEMAKAIYPKAGLPSDVNQAKKTHPQEYDIGKRTILGCFEPDTMVLTQFGWKPIIEVSYRDWLWDGEEWVSHDGVVDQGVKDTIRFAGIGVTPDHLFLTPAKTWVSASAVLRESIAYLQSMTATVACGLWDSASAHAGVCSESGLSAVVGAYLWPTWSTSDGARRHAVIRAQNAPPLKPVKAIGAMQPFVLMMPIERGFLTESPQPSSGVKIHEITTTNTTVSAGSAFGGLGEKIAACFSRICLRSKAGMIRLLSLIAFTTTRDTGPAISDLRHAEAITRTVGKWLFCSGRFSGSKRSSRVYDVLNAGPRNRFTILTDAGPAVVHNCGYGMGWKKFRDNIYTETAKKGRPVLIPDTIAQRAVSAYREKYPGVKALWYEAERAAISAVEAPGKAFPCAGGRVLWGMSADRRFLGCKLPSGRFLRYWQPSVAQVWKTWCEDPKCPHILKGDVTLCPEREQRKELCYVGENTFTHQWGRIHMYGGLLVENVDQAIARDLIVQGMQNAEAAGFDLLLTVHDEGLAEVAAWRAETALTGFLAALCKTPAWAEGCPVAAEGWIGGRYRK